MSKSVKQIMDDAKAQAVALEAIQGSLKAAHEAAHKEAEKASLAFGTRKFKTVLGSIALVGVKACNEGVGCADYIPAAVWIQGLGDLITEEARGLAQAIIDACDLLEGEV